jgi:hypothetical protein
MFRFHTLEKLYLWGFLPLELLVEIVYQWLPQAQTLPFVPLMMISVYCSLGVSYCFLALYRELFRL